MTIMPIKEIGVNGITLKCDRWILKKFIWFELAADFSLFCLMYRIGYIRYSSLNWVLTIVLSKTDFIRICLAAALPFKK